MDLDTSPFRPGQPVPVEYFVGRVPEIERLYGMVKASARGRLTAGFATGERGIGKSSLVEFVRHLSEQEPGVAGWHSYLGGVRTVEGMLGKTCEQLLKGSVSKPWYDKVAAFFGDRVRKVGLFGVTLELRLSPADLATIANNFAPSILGLAEQLEDRKAILLVLDDINGLAASAEFANWLKSLVDELATAGRPVPLCILVAGLEARRRELIANQPSLGRVFNLIDIAPWSEGETVEFFRRAFSSAGVELSESDLRFMAEFSGGLPALAQQIGESVWTQAAAQKVSRKAVVEGIVSAAEVIGRKLIEPQVFAAIRSERYRSMLRTLAEKFPAEVFDRSELREHLAAAEGRLLDNFLRRMRKLGVIDADEDVRGRYRFANRLHALYFRIDALRA